MKKIELHKFMALVLALSFVFGFSGLAYGSMRNHTDVYYVNDFANVLDENTRQYVIDTNNDISASGAEIVVVTVDFLDGMTAREYATNLYNQWGVGSDSNGFLLLLAIADDDYFVASGIAAEDIISNGEMQAILDTGLYDDFEAGDFSKGVQNTVSAMKEKIMDYAGAGSIAANSAAPALTADNANYVNDAMDVLSIETTNHIITQNTYLYQANGGQITVVTVDTVGNSYIGDYAQDLLNRLGVGDRYDNNGILILLSMDDGLFEVAYGSGFNSTGIREIEKIISNDLEPYLINGEYDRGVRAAFDSFYDLIIELWGDEHLVAAPGASYTNSNTAPVPGPQYRQSGLSGFMSFMGGLIMLLVFIGIIYALSMLFRGGRRFGGGRTVIVGAPVRPRRRYIFFGPRYPRRHMPPPPPRSPMPPPASRPMNPAPPQPKATPPPARKPSQGIFGGGSAGGSMGGSMKPGGSGGSMSRGGGAGKSAGGGMRSSGSSMSRPSSPSRSSGGSMSRGGGAGRSSGGSMSRGGGAGKKR